MKKILKTVILFLLVLIIVDSLYFTLSNQIKPKYCELNNELLYYEYFTINNNDKKEIRAELNELFGNPLYLYINHKFRNQNNKGMIIYIIKTILVNENTDTESYIFALAHELSHLTLKTKNECVCNFNTFKLLYESENQDFVNVAKYYAYKDMNNENLNDYSFWYYANEYLEEKAN